MKPLLPLLILTIILFSSCSSQQSSGCPFPHPDHQEGDLCGFLEVPRDRNAPERGMIKLAYVVIKSKTENPKRDPVVYLQGGPGGSVIPYMNIYKQFVLDTDRDFILFDQRGTGYSEAICEDLPQTFLSALSKDLIIEEEFDLLDERFTACQNEVEKGGGLLSDYNTFDSAADLEDLRKHLGYETWNLFGGSYGTRLGLIYMQLFPRVVRSSVFMGLFPPHVRMYDHVIRNFDRSLQMVFEACEADHTCNQKYPDLKNHFQESLDELEKAPFSYTWNGNNFTLNAQDMLIFLHQMLYAPATYQNIPAYIMAVKNRSKEDVATFTTQQTQRIGFVNIAIFWAVMHGDEGTFDNEAKHQKELSIFPQYQKGISLFASGARALSALKDQVYKVPAPVSVEANIPTLLISGEYDPITPPSNADEAAKYLPNSYAATFKGNGHASVNRCFLGMAKEFLNAPEKEPDTSCAENGVSVNWR